MQIGNIKRLLRPAKTLIAARGSMKATIIAAMAGAAFCGASTAHANLIIQASETGFTTTTILTVFGTPSTDPSGATSLNFGDFTIKILGSEADMEGGPTAAELFSSSTKIQNSQFGSAGTHTLVLNISATDYTAPTAPPTLDFNSSIGGSTGITGSPANVLTFQGYVDPTNTATTAGAYTSGLQNVTPVTPATTSFNSNAGPTPIAVLPSPYAILGTISITLGANSSLNFAATETLSVPEPASLGLLSLAGVGLLARRRRV